MATKALIRGAVAAGVALTAFLPAAVDAQAAPASNVIVVRMNGNHITLSKTTVRPGNWVFKVVSVDGKDHTLQILRLHKGYTMQQAGADINKAFSGDIAAINRVDHRITWRGGVEAHQAAGWFATGLAANRYVLLDQNTTGHQFLTVTGAPRNDSPPATTTNLTAFTYGFGGSGRFLANGWMQLWNQSDQPHFFVFQQVKPGTTHRQVKQYFSSGSQQPPPWALPAGTTSGVVSPFTGERMHLALPAGKYVVACFWPDDETGMPHAAMGMWAIINLR